MDFSCPDCDTMALIVSWPTKIVLIDGGLLDFMLRHHVGARVERMIEVLDLDHNYFDDDE